MIFVNFAAQDFTPGPYYATFNVNEDTAEFNVNIINDIEVEGNEIFHVFIGTVMSDDYNIKFHDPYNATVTIKDDDCKQLHILA